MTTHKNIVKTIILCTLSGCAQISASPPAGILYQGVTGVSPNFVVQQEDGARPGPKSSRACAHGVLGLAAWGDMSVEKAKRRAGIARVDTIDFRNVSVLGIYTKRCTLITGE